MTTEPSGREAVLEPLNCPFCGDEVSRNSFWFCKKPGPPERYHVFCIDCEFDGPSGDTLEHAIAVWNVRAEPPAADAAPLAAGPEASQLGDSGSPSIPTQEWGELERAAREATPGPWFHRQPGHRGPKGERYDWIADAEGQGQHHKVIVPRETVYGGSADYAYIAAANPATILRLIAERSALEEERDQAVRLYEKFVEMEAETNNKLVNCQAALTDLKAEVVRVVEPLNRMAKHIQADVASAHSNRGNGASQWMREDDNEFRRDLDAAFRALAQLSSLSRGSPETEEGEGS